MTLATEVVRRLEDRDVVFTTVGDNLVLEAPDGTLTDRDMAFLREHKQELLALLRLRHRPAEWHAEEVARRVVEEGFSLFWATEFQELVAFVLDASFTVYLPPGVVSYTVRELDALCSGMSGPVDLALLHSVHRAKKTTGGAVRDITSDE